MGVFEKWGQLSINTGEVFKRSVNVLRPVMEDMNRKQLLEGKRADDSSLSPYSRPYARKRRKAGLQTAVKDLKFRGDFHRGIYAVGFENFVEMGSKDLKSGEIEVANGEIFGLSENNLDTVKGLLKEQILTDLKSLICGI